MLELKYFVLKPRGKGEYAVASRAAMRAFAKAIEKEDKELALSLVEWADIEMSRAAKDAGDE